MSQRKDNALPEGAQGYIAAGLIFQAFGWGFDAFDTIQNYLYGASFGGWLVGAVYGACGFGMAFTMSMLGWLGLSYRKPHTLAIAAMFLIFLAVTCQSAIEAHGARMGLQINQAHNSQKSLADANRDDEETRQAERKAAEAKEAADKALASRIDAPSLEDVNKAISDGKKAIAGHVLDLTRKGIEEPTPEAICNRQKACRDERKALRAWEEKLPAARSKDDAQKAADAKNRELAEARERAQSARTRLEELRKAGGGGSTLANAASIYGGDAQKTAQDTAALNARLFTVLTVSVAILGSFVGGWLLSLGNDIKRRQMAAEKPKGKQAPKQATQAQKAEEPTEKPISDGFEQAQTEAQKPKPERPKKKRDGALRQKELAAAAQMVAQNWPKVVKAQVIAHLESHFGTSRSTAQRIVQQAIEQHAQNEENGVAQIYEPKVGSAHK